MPYGIADFRRIRNEGWYYADKTMFLAKLEERDPFVFFVRPRRFGKSIAIDDISGKFTAVVGRVRMAGAPIFPFIDEYDNFTNTLIRSSGRDPYREVAHGTGFYQMWFKRFKGDVDRIFMTGVSPVTMDDLTSGFNIAAAPACKGEERMQSGC